MTSNSRMLKYFCFVPGVFRLSVQSKENTNKGLFVNETYHC